MMGIFLQVLFHPLPPSTAACLPQRELAGWWRCVCKEREIILPEHNPKEAISQFIHFIDSHVLRTHIFPSHLSTTSMSKQKRLSIESLFLLTHDCRLNISGGPFTTPFCQQGDVFAICTIRNWWYQGFSQRLSFWYCNEETVLLSTFSFSPSTTYFLLFNVR